MSRKTTACALGVTAAVLAATGLALSDDGAAAAAIEQLHADLDRIGTQLDRLQDEREIKNLQRSYGYYVDKGLWDGVADLFAEEDGTLEIGGRGVFVGRERIAEYMHWLTPEGPQEGQVFNHTQFQPVLTVNEEGDHAQGRWRALVIGGTTTGLGLWGEVTYENSYVKRDGRWQFESLLAFFNFYSVYAEGWQHSRWPNTRPEEDLPPDRPPTYDYDMYPEIHMVPYHYPNPVSGR